ncbi:pentapeptide repeat-containing protein [Flammeovirga yaeyamensis]|uniref:Pentapeptide repeat-containing protein n=1 Tax=Flammeovirga yaeyamensis TaxID=367791 RepID=A0AAX1N5C7_9BACT|nr:pentapeptide repeat-containing protein [Flammeovirga yaeyamensis]MBB3701256.1 hypothetical protein [Flammeovirga yaeyamensis]NMF38274.1 hypothetical protein [Flammeovirga yaeyamensis]QWG02685.1 pentapeptide repeat-containing protein [Flammeovirga yaeyamensis]
MKQLLLSSILLFLNVQILIAQNCNFKSGIFYLDRDSVEYEVCYDSILLNEFDNNSILIVTNIISNGNFEMSLFVNELNFSNAKFNSEANFLMAEFNSEAFFSKAKFNSEAFFSMTKFNSEAFFSKTEFNSKADFSMAEFISKAYFLNTKFNNFTDFSTTEFNSEVYFLSTKFNNFTDFSDTNFNNFTDFTGTRFDSATYFISAIFNSKADFTGARFDSEANFSLTEFNSIIYFSKSIFKEKIDFSNSTLPDTIIFDQVTSEEIVDLSLCKLNPNKTICHISLNSTNIEKFKFDYSQGFKLYIQYDSTRNFEKHYTSTVSVYEQIMKMQEKYGYNTGYEKADKEKKEYTYISKAKLNKKNWLGFPYLWYHGLNKLDYVWWDYGYNKMWIFRNTFIIFIALFLINIPFTLTNKLRNTYDIILLHSILESNNFFIKYIYYNFLFTSFVFFGIKLDFKEIKYTNKLVSLLIIFQYVLGLICMAYIANTIIIG